MGECPVSARAGIPRRGAAAGWLLASWSLACALGIALAAGAPARAGADVFSPISLVSYGSVAGGPLQQVEYAHDAAISADGRYVAFDGALGGVTGVWRRDLETGVIEQVAGGEASRPSISGDGQYVSFATDEGARLPEATHGQPNAEPMAEAQNVYVRNMANAPAATAAEEGARAPAARAFLIVSASSGSDEPLRYAAPQGAGEATAGSFAVGRTAMSANGEEVVFMTEARSNLVAYPALEEEERERGETPQPHAPAGQVAVRYMNTGVTELVSRCRFGCSQGAAAGATEPVTVSEPAAGRQVGGGSGGASISADGSAVAWMGEDLAQQTATLPAEGLEASYTEPLWRRLPAAANQTRRVSGGSDPEDAACAASGASRLAPGSENAADPCQGPFVVEVGAEGGSGGFLGKGNTNVGARGSAVPQLSADGEEVAFVSEARLLSEGADFNRGSRGNSRDLFVAAMRPGLSRDQALEPLTEVGAPEVVADEAGIVDFAISPDGTQVAFATVRTNFALGEPTLISAPLPEPGINELYDADLQNETITRVTHGYEGGASEQPHKQRLELEDPYEASIGEKLGAFSPAFSEDGEKLVFTSTADNLVYGDGNTPPGEPVIGSADGSDVFEVERHAFEAQPAPQQVSLAPPLTTGPAWTMGATAVARPDGSVVLYAWVPGAGTLDGAARGAVVVTEKPRHGARARHPRRSVQERQVAAAHIAAWAPEGELVTLVLRLAKPYAGLAAGSDGLSADVTLSFSSPGQRTLTALLAVTFKRAKAPAKHAPTKHAAAKGARRRAKKKRGGR